MIYYIDPLTMAILTFKLIKYLLCWLCHRKSWQYQDTFLAPGKGYTITYQRCPICDADRSTMKRLSYEESIELFEAMTK